MFLQSAGSAARRRVSAGMVVFKRMATERGNQPMGYAVAMSCAVAPASARSARRVLLIASPVVPVAPQIQRRANSNGDRTNAVSNVESSSDTEASLKISNMAVPLTQTQVDFVVPLQP